MANHGYCKNCWWYKMLIENNGNCFMQNKITQDNCYCPDYINRLKEEKKFGKLDDWIKKN